MRLGALLLLWLFSNAALAMSVAFINPGKSDEVYWLTAARAMSAAAQGLGVRLEVHYAERQHLRALDIARELIGRPPEKRPDYVICSNDYGTGPELLRLFEHSGIKVFMAFSGIVEATDRAQSGIPRQRYPHWLGSLEPRADDAGYQTARQLIVAGRKAGLKSADGRLHLLAISGDRSTPTSIRRGEGMHRAVLEMGDVVIDQEVFAAWSREKAEAQAEWLYARHSSARLVWAGNDLMAFGAMQAWEKRGGKPGQSALFSGINTSREALEANRSGRLSALSGGHFIAGAWALVMLFDYHHGRDFAADEGLELEQPMFVAFDARLAERFEQRYGNLDFSAIDFSRYSKVRNPRLKRYDFRFRQLLD